MKKALSIMITISMLLSLIFAFNIYAAGDAVTVDGITYESNDTYCVLTKCDQKISGDVIIPSSVNFNGELLPVTSINGHSFWFCTKITSITIPDSVTKIGTQPFYGCVALVNIIVDENNAVFSSYEGVLFNKDKTAVIICPIAKANEFVIPDGVISIDSDAFQDCRSITSITIPESVESIGDIAFNGCESLTSIKLPKNVVTIGDSVFGNCNSLVKIEVDQDNTEFISSDGVLFNKDMTTIIAYPNAKSAEYIIPDDVRYIGDYAFATCEHMTSITIPESVISIGDYAFFYCIGLSSITIPGSVESIGDHAFDRCRGLESIIIPDGITSIGAETFRDCISLKTIVIPNSITKIVWYAFDGCTSLENAYYLGTEEQWNENVKVYKENECLLNALVFHTVHEYDDDSDLVCNICGYERVDPTLLFTVTFYDYDGSVISSEEYYYGDEINIPEDPFREEDEEGKHIFKGWDKPVTNCTGDAEYTAVYEGLYVWLQGFQFEDCETYCKLVRCDKSVYGNISIPSSVTINGKELPVKSIGDEAFAGCTDITSIIIPDSVKEIGTFTFGSCTGLVSVIIGNGLERINYKAFCGCSSLENIVIGKGVTLICINAFENCTSLETIVIPDNVTEIGSSEIEYAFDMEFPYWENPGVFHNCVNLKNVIVGSGVTSFGEYDYTFSDCTSLNNIIVSEDNETYSSHDGVLFSKDMTKLIIYPKGKNASEYKIPEGVTSIAMYAFLRCSNLKKIDIPDTVTRISHGAFRNCVNLEIINIPESVTDIGLAAFSGCVKLTKINLPSGLTSIKSGTFGYTGLKNISVPDGVTTIYGDSYDLYDGIDVIMTEGAYCSSDIESIIIPKSVTSIGEGAFYDCDKLKTVYYKGSEEQWKAIDISWSNEPLTNAHIIFNYSKDYLPGDCNKDGEVDNKDVVELFRYVSRKDKLEDESVYDFNGDGEVNNRDVVELFRSVSTLQKPENSQTQPDPDETGDPTDTTTDPDETRDDPTDTATDPDETKDDPDDTCDPDETYDPDVTGEEKPIIYLYPEEKTDCSVKIDYSGKLTCTYPEYKENGWENFTAYPDGTLVFPNGRQYYALFWEGESDIDYDFSEGFCVKGEDTAEFLYGALKKAGLNEKEANEFIIYWLPRMQNNAYNLISFQTTVYTENAKLIITPEPDTVIRVFMAFKPLREYKMIKPQALDAPERKGFTVVEWGGAELK